MKTPLLLKILGNLLVLGALFAAAFWLRNGFSQTNARVDGPEARLRATVEYLASPELGGREAGSEGHERAREAIVREMRALGYETRVDDHPSPVGLTKGRIRNILSVLPAERNPGDRCVVLVAHYDHNPHMDGEYSPGANDNASGVAVLLELARRARSFHRGSNYDLHFAFPDQEENFIVGSRYVAEQLAGECRQVLFSLTLDVVGAPFFPGFENRLLVLGSESSGDLENLVETSSARYARAREDGLIPMSGPIFLIEPAGIARSDYKAFRKERIPFAFLTAGIPAEYHTPEDTVDKVDFPFLARVADYVEHLLTDGMAAATDAKFEFVKKPSFRPGATAADVAEILSLMLAHADENELSEKERAKFAERIEELRTNGDAVTRLCLQGDVIRLIQVVSRRSPVAFAYLKSILGKLF
jgi:aminopeptidase YwaD